MDNQKLIALLGLGGLAAFLFLRGKNNVQVGGPALPYNGTIGIPYSATQAINSGNPFLDSLPDFLKPRTSDNVVISQNNCTEYYVYGERKVVCGPGGVWSPNSIARELGT